MRSDLDKLRALLAVLATAPMFGKAAAAEAALKCAVDLLEKIVNKLERGCDGND